MNWPPQKMNLQTSDYIPCQYRPDIDGLRALAVLAVVAYHASPLRMKGGFIGVDIFFVISGFLISTLIFQNLERNSFSFIDFYSRRIKRIFPALLFVLASCFLFGWISLYSDEYQQLGKHIIGGGGFLSNFLLWYESGYFDNLAESKPLLHLWSLGIEEQFYIICPFLLWFLRKRQLNPLMPILLLFLISFACNLMAVHNDIVGAFYSPQTRFWELLVGVILAYLMLYGSQRSHAKSSYINNLMSVIGLGLILLGFFLITNLRLFPGVWALFPTIGAALIIGAGAQAWLNKNIFAHKVMVWFGLISFPLYLWHWPILSFIHIIKNGHAPSFTVRVLAVLASVLCAWLTYCLVEKPIRHGKQTRMKPLAFASIMVMLAGLLVYQNDGYPSRTALAAKNKSWTERQQVIAGYEKSKIYQQTTAIKERDFYLGNTAKNEKPDIAILGDSHANRLYWALADYKELKLINLGRGTCPPLIDVDVYGMNGKSIDCQPVTNNYLHYIKEDPHIKMIVINAFYNQYKKNYILKANNKKISLEDALNNTLNYFKGTHKKILVTLDVPTVPQTCYQRSFPVWKTPPNTICTIEKDELALQSQPLLAVLKLHPEIRIFNPESVFCNKQCGEIDAHNYLYLHDGHHLNDFGLARLSPAMHEAIMQELG